MLRTCVFFRPRKCYLYRCVHRQFSTDVTKKQPEEYEVVVIGGGSTGLSMSFFLSCLKRKHVVLEKGDDVGFFWKDNLWDSFKHATPAWSIQLPAMDVKQENEEDFFTQKEMFTHLQEYSKMMKVPIKLKQNVTQIKYESVLDEKKENKYLIETSGGESFVTRDVVICTGACQTPKAPPLAKKLPTNIKWLHSSQYRNPGMVGQVVLVVGSGQSGLEIVNELVDAGKNVFLSLGNHTATFPRRYRGYDNMDWLSRMGYFDQSLKSMAQDPGSPTPAQLRSQTSSSSYVTDQPWFLFQLVERGVVVLGRLRDQALMNEGRAQVLEFERLGTALEDSELSHHDFRAAVDSFILEQKLRSIPPDPPYPPKPNIPARDEILSMDLKVAGIDTVIFATGYTGLKFPMLAEMVKEKERQEQYTPGEKNPMWFEDGYPATANGQSLAFPGLYFLGLRWLMSAASSTLFGAPFDASVVAMKIARMRGYPHQNMIAPQFLDPRSSADDDWNKADAEDEEHASDSEDEGESERAAKEEREKYFPFASPEPLDPPGIADAEILESILPPKPPPLDPNNLPLYLMKEKPKKPKNRHLTDAELQREKKNREILSRNETPKTAEELQKLLEKEETEVNATDANGEKNPFERWQPRQTNKQAKPHKKKHIDPYGDFAGEEKKILDEAMQKGKKSFISSAHPKHKKPSPGDLFSMTNIDLKKLEDDDSSRHISFDYSKKPKKGVRGTIERYLQGHRGLKDIRKQKTPRK